MDPNPTSIWTTLVDVWSLPMLHALTEGSLAFAIVWVVWRLLRGFASANLGYALFVIVLVKLIASLALPSGSSWHGWLSPTTWFATEASVSHEGSELGPFAVIASDEVDAPTTALGTEWPRWAFLIWALIVLLLTLRFAVRQNQLAALVRRARPVRVSEAGGLDLAELCKAADVHRRVRWLVSADVASPAAGGILRPFVLLPPRFACDMSPAALRFVLLHELAHIRRHDAAASLVQRAAQILLFFHPAVWWTNRALDELREFACDAAAVACCGGHDARRECGAGLLSVVESARGRDGRGAAHAMAIFGDDKSVIRRRLMNILAYPSHQARCTRVVGWAIVSAVALLVLPNAAASAARADSTIAASTAQDPQDRDALRQIERLERRIARLQQQQAELQREVERARDAAAPKAGPRVYRRAGVAPNAGAKARVEHDVGEIFELAAPSVVESVEVEGLEADRIEVDALAEIVLEDVSDLAEPLDPRDLAGIVMRSRSAEPKDDATEWRVLRAPDPGDAPAERGSAAPRAWSKSVSITIDSEGRVQIDDHSDHSDHSDAPKVESRARARSVAPSKPRKSSVYLSAPPSADGQRSPGAVIFDGDRTEWLVVPDGEGMRLIDGWGEIVERDGTRVEVAPRAGATKRVERTAPRAERVRSTAPRVVRRSGDRSPI